ncbi:MAG: Asp-tRNA(Asn)/Glu-tRNA(Gln) amidotransferase subunit GatB [Clostridia bacterium]|nr:Asp-tRNA(Asn)/Glu-tRNA(Gln) amidotransferase subunit GatB [Clostridia bacterium]
MRGYELVVGLEVHVELKTKTKLFCACSTEFGLPPNTACCPVCQGLPGALPTWNREAIRLAVKAGLALGCRIRRVSTAARKQYFYPDLPKGYQISQGDLPLCEDGSLTVDVEGVEKTVGIARIHVEEDAGKLMHVGDKTFIDGNRCGTPLIEIVSLPVLHSGGEASAYLRALREILVACGISDCKMQEGSMRCDVNLSVRKEGDDSLGTRTEIKNINSFSFVEKAIAYEASRQIGLLERGECVLSQTRRYDEKTGETVLMRTKERADDYRFIEEADLPPIRLADAQIDAIGQEIGELPRARRRRLSEQFGISSEDAAILTSDPSLTAYFEEAAEKTSYPKLLSGLVLSELLRYCEGEEFSSPISAERMAELASLMGDGVITSSVAKKLILRLLDVDFSPGEIVEREALGQIRDEELLSGYVQEAIAEMPRAVEDYQAGKAAALQSLIGKVMAKTKGRAAPELTRQLLEESLRREGGNGDVLL